MLPRSPRPGAFARAILAAVALGGLLALAPRAASAQDAKPNSTQTPFRLEVSGPAADVGETPVVVPVGDTIAAGSYQFPVTGGTRPAQVFEQGGRRYAALVVDGLKANQPFAADLTSAPPGQPAPGVRLVANGQKVEFRVGGELLTVYVPDDGPKPFFFPLIGPGGAAMTRAFPMERVAGETLDHPHHRSVWFAHGSVNKVDFWSILPGHGSIRETSRAALVDGPVVGVLQTTDDWLDASGKLVARDERVVRAYATKAGRVLDFEVTLKAPDDAAVVLGDTKEGTFALRVATTMDVTAKKGGKIVTSEKLTDKAAWGKPAAWVDYAGPVAGQTAGIAILNHPHSFRYPTTWHVRDYGLFAANPFGYHDFGQKETGEYRLEPGQSLRFAYRVILHPRATDATDLDRAQQGYAGMTHVMALPAPGR